MVFDTGLFSLNLALVDYIEKIEDKEQGYGIKIVFLAETQKAPKIVFFGSVKEFRPGEWETEHKCTNPNRFVSIFSNSGTVEYMESFAIPNFKESGISKMIVLKDDYPNDPWYTSIDKINDSSCNRLSLFAQYYMKNLQTDLMKRDEFYKMLIDQMNANN
jgi:hypothetical protein